MRIRYKPYHRYKKQGGRAILLWRCGALKFKTNFRSFFESKRGGDGAFHAHCAEEAARELNEGNLHMTNVAVAAQQLLFAGPSLMLHRKSSREEKVKFLGSYRIY